MGFFSDIEEKTADALKAVVLDAKQLLADADAEIARLESELLGARHKAADFAVKVKVAAEEAASKAKAVAETLATEAEAAAKTAEERISKIITPHVVDPTPAPVVDPIPAPVVDPSPLPVFNPPDPFQPIPVPVVDQTPVQIVLVPPTQ